MSVAFCHVLLCKCLGKRSKKLIHYGIVTGGAGALALEGAKALLDHGLQGLALWDISFDHSEAGVEELRKEYPTAKIATIDVDVRDSKSIDMALEATVRTFGSVNIMCCFAGVVGCTPSVDVGAEEWRRVMDINCNGTFLCAQAAARCVPRSKAVYSRAS